MPAQFLVDTDIMVDYLRGHPDAVKYIKTNADYIAISLITAAELYAGVNGDKEEKELEAFLDLFPVLTVTREIAQKAGRYKKEFFKSHNLGLADALIAASADYYHMNLKTLNRKHFPMFGGLEPPYQKTFL